MNFAFFGTPKFAEIILEKLVANGFVPSVVITNPDKPLGRKKIITSPPVKQRIMSYESGIKKKIKILQPESLKIENCPPGADPPLAGPPGAPARPSGVDPPLAEKLKITEIDFAVVAAYSKIIPKEVLEIPRLGVIGVHPSLLPKYRGPSPIQTAILDGAAETGTSLFLMDEKIDHGPIFAQQKLQITNDKLQFLSLLEKLAEISGELLVKIIPDFIAGKIRPEPQDETLATYTKKFKTDDGFVNLEKDSPEVILRKIRALNPEPGIYTLKNGKRLKLLEAETRDNKIIITKIQWEGKKPRDSNLLIS